VNHLKVRFCLIDGEVVCCDETSFQLLRHRRNEPEAFLYAFDLLELNGVDLRREPIEVRGDLGEHPAQEPPGRAAESTPGARLRPDGPPARLQDGTGGDRL
jgi:ATP-dependent DNA ligase